MSQNDEECKLLIEFMVMGLRRRLNLSETQCFEAIAPDYSPVWGGNPIIEVVPGQSIPYGEGQGAQEGGAILRKQTVTLYVFLKLNLDQIGMSEQILTNANQNLMDIFKQIRALFALTCFPLSPEINSPDQYLLFEPMKWAGESPTVWEDPKLYVAMRSVSFDAVYGVELPIEETLGYGDIS